MEHVFVPGLNPHLNRVLKDYQSAAMRSLNGPATWDEVGKIGAEPKSENELADCRRKALLLSVVKNEKKADSPDSMSSPRDAPPHAFSPPFPVHPLFMPMDTSKSEKSETMLEGESIACFVVGGERRLCLPQILNTVLRDFALEQINIVCDELHIFCSRCNPEQLEILKLTDVLPVSAPSCGLITHTDAERLCNALFYVSPQQSAEPRTPGSFKVSHECFGKCKGVFTPELYTTAQSTCIRCCDCAGLFSPPKFVCHSHKALENRTCHWGFDSANWRAYLQLAKDQPAKDKLESVLEDIKAKFDYASGANKRKSDEDGEKCPADERGKKSRYEDEAALCSWPVIGMSQYRGQMSAFRPWSPSVLSLLKEAKFAAARDGYAITLPSFLHTGPPILLNPERVVPHSESHRYERHFAPNVSLAPPRFQKDKSDDWDDDNNVTSPSSNKRPGSVPPAPQAPSPPPLTVLVEKPRRLKLQDVTAEKLRSPMPPPSQPPAHVVSPTTCSMPTTPRDASRSLVRQLLSGGGGGNHAGVRQASSQHSACDRLVAQLEAHVAAENTHIKQEAEYMKMLDEERLRELTDANESLQRELLKQRAGHELAMSRLRVELAGIRDELDAAKKSRHVDVAKTKAKYRGQVTQLRSQLYDRDKEINELRALRLSPVTRQVTEQEVQTDDTTT